MPRRFFVARARGAAACGVFLVLQKNRKIQGRSQPCGSRKGARNFRVRDANARRGKAARI
jgi:hypothetical protein